MLCQSLPLPKHSLQLTPLQTVVLDGSYGSVRFCVVLCGSVRFCMAYPCSLSLNSKQPGNQVGGILFRFATYLHIGANMSETRQEPKRRSEHPTPSVMRRSQRASSKVTTGSNISATWHDWVLGVLHALPGLVFWGLRTAAGKLVESECFLTRSSTRRISKNSK